MNFSRIGRHLAAVVAAFALAALTAPVAGATPAPAPGYEQFDGCPDPGSVPTIETCYRSVVDGGELQMGNVQIPITVPIVLSGGMTSGGAFVHTETGGMLPAKQSVPGGVVGLTGFTWLLEFFGAEALAVKAVFELAGAPGDQLASPASLPIKIHLVNSILGKNCYLGSNKQPIELELTTGTTSPPSPNVPITGSPGTSNTTPSGIADVTGGTFVDNAFAGRGANGCVLTLFGFPPESIDADIDEQSGLPSEAGTNTTIQEFDSEYVSSAIVYP